MTEKQTCWFCSDEHDQCPYDCEEQLKLSEQMRKDWEREQDVESDEHKQQELF